MVTVKNQLIRKEIHNRALSSKAVEIKPATAAAESFEMVLGAVDQSRWTRPASGRPADLIFARVHAA
jgi:hypothetical protein